LTKGHFFAVKFVKKTTGEIRILNGHPKCKKYIKGTGSEVVDGRAVVLDRAALRKNLKEGMARLDAGAKAYRSFYPDSIVELHVGGKVYDGEGKEAVNG
jgi:hypothetical protein